MKISLNKVLLAIPLYQLSFITSFPKEEITYGRINTSLENEWTVQDTILTIDQNDEWKKINDLEVAKQLAKNQNLAGIVICNKIETTMKEEIVSFYEKNNVSILQISRKESLKYFFDPIVNNKYETMGLEIEGFYKRGFIDIAANLAMGLSIPLVFLDENRNILWRTGSEPELQECLRWIKNNHGEGKFQDSSKIGKINTNENDYPYIQFTLNISDQVQLYLISSAEISQWQKNLLDKFNGLTALMLRTDEFVRKKNEQYKEVFIYELIYRKFESKKSLVSQGKALGWNLDKPHHLLIIDVGEDIAETEPDNFYGDLIYHLELQGGNSEYPLIIFQFQEEIVVLAEDGREQPYQKRKTRAIEIGNWLQKNLADFMDDIKFNIGIGKWYDDAIDLNKSYQEAKIAIIFGKLWFTNKVVHHINDLGVIYLLTNIHRDLLESYCQQYLSPLIESDKNRGTEYLETLKMFFQYNGVIKDISEAMYLHPNSLRKRLQNIESISGVDLQNIEDLLGLMVAVKIYYIHF